MAKSIMIQGTGSNVGKSILVAGMARACLRRGIKVAPFKPQNMSNNAAVTTDGGEIGRAQALQARAAGLAPIVDMNPVLLKPESDIGAQIIVQGQRFKTLKAGEYGKQKHRLMPAVMESFQRLTRTADFILVEGAGSPAEVNLRNGDIANMGFAEAADIPVILTGDIDRGGVIAQLVGTYTVLPAADRNRIKGFIVNKFRGDTNLFTDGLSNIVDRTGWENIGVLPWFTKAQNLPGEDMMDITSSAGGPIKIVVPRLGRIANFDDLDPLACEPSVSLEIIDPGTPLPGDANLVLIPGSKSTIADLSEFRQNGWDIDLAAHIRRRGHVLGICAGYQMLGNTISDPDGIEGPAISVSALGHLNVDTTMSPIKRLAQTRACHRQSGTEISAYEIHIGETHGPDCAQNWLETAGRSISAASENNQIKGCYLHGIFSNDGFRRCFLSEIGTPAGSINYEATVEDTLDQLADHIETHLNLDLMISLASKV